MDCKRARRLLLSGAKPGPESPTTAELGFHILDCAQCRALRDEMLDDLSRMLSRDPAGSGQSAARAQSSSSFAPPAAFVQTGHVEQSPPRRTFRRLKPTRRTLITLLIIILWILFLVTIWYGRSLFASAMGPLPGIRSGLQAKAGVLAQASATPSPTATPAPTASATPTPTASATPTPTASATPTPQPQAMNVLLLGLDRRPGETTPSRSDAIMVIHIDPAKGKVSLLSLARDLRVDIPGRAPGKINSAYTFGELNSGAQGGMALARRTIARLLAVRIDHVVALDFVGFIKLIDDLGGIQVDVPKYLYDPRFPTMDYGYQKVEFAAGPQHMDGITALIFSRIRHPDSDFQRIRRQQLVIIGVIKRLKELAGADEATSTQQLVDVLLQNVETDLAPDEAYRLLAAIEQLQPGDIARDAVDYRHGYESFQGGYALVPDLAAVRQLAQSVLGQE